MRIKLSEYGKEEVNHIETITDITYVKNTVARYFEASFEKNKKIRMAVKSPSSMNIKLKTSLPLVQATDGSASRK
jgi:hypothetical protein